MASKFYNILQGLVAEEKGTGFSIPNGRLFIIWEGKYCGIWTFGGDKVHFDYLWMPPEPSIKDHIAHLFKFSSWKKMMLYKRNHAKALILYGVFKQLRKLFQKSASAAETYIMANGWWDQYSQLSGERKEHISLTFGGLKKMGMQLRHNFLKRLVHERSLKKIYRKSFPKLDSAFRNALMKQPHYLETYISYKKEFNQHAKLIHFKNMNRILVLLGLTDLYPNSPDSELVFRWFARWHEEDDGAALRGLCTEAAAEVFEGLREMRHPNWFNARHEAVLEARRRLWQHGWYDEEAQEEQRYMEHAWIQSIPENRSTVPGVTLLETKEDYINESSTMQHCVASYWCDRADGYRKSYHHVWHLKYNNEHATMMLNFNENGIRLVQIYGVRNAKISTKMKLFAAEFYAQMKFRNRSRFMDCLRRF